MTWTVSDDVLMKFEVHGSHADWCCCWSLFWPDRLDVWLWINFVLKPLKSCKVQYCTVRNVSTWLIDGFDGFAVNSLIHSCVLELVCSCLGFPWKRKVNLSSNWLSSSLSATLDRKPSTRFILVVSLSPLPFLLFILWLCPLFSHLHTFSSPSLFLPLNYPFKALCSSYLVCLLFPLLCPSSHPEPLLGNRLM